MRLGMIGLGRMGGDMAQRLLSRGHEVIGYSKNRRDREALEEIGGTAAGSVPALVERLESPRVVWLMIPAGKPVDEVIEELAGILAEGDIVVDGGNSFYKDTMRHARLLRRDGIRLVDVGTSGGVRGLREGYSLTIGGEREAVARLRPVFESLAPKADRGWGYVGPSGAGHFAKMIHNGIEYGLMQAYAEGFNLLKHRANFDLDLAEVARIWRHGSIVGSRLLDLVHEALEENPSLEGIAPWVADSGEGRWAAREAIDLGVPAPVITHALHERFRSREERSFADRLLSAMRNRFGGHRIKREGDA